MLPRVCMPELSGMEPAATRSIFTVLLAIFAGLLITVPAAVAGTQGAPVSELVAAKAGQSYVASARIRARPGGRVCLRVQERAAGARIGSASRCAKTTGRWQRIASLRYRTRLAGSRLRVTVHGSKPRHGHVTVAAGSMTLQPMARCKRNCTPPPPPPPPPAPPPPPGPPPPPSPGVDVGSQFHCNWDFYTNPDRLTVLDKLAS